MMNAQLKKDVATSKSYMLEVNSATQLAHVFQALQTIGISDAAVERTDVSNMDELRQQVRGASAKAARQNAEILAAALGQKVGKAIFVQDNSYYSRPYSNVVLTRTMKVADAGVAATAAPTLEFQKSRSTILYWSVSCWSNRAIIILSKVRIFILSRTFLYVIVQTFGEIMCSNIELPGVKYTIFV